MFWRRRKSGDFSAEIDAHIQQEIERFREQGMSPEDARAAARRAFGNITLAQERFYERSHWMWWDHLKQDVRFGLRMLAKSPGFTAVAVLTLALGIGANTVIFSVVYAVLMKPLPFQDAGKLVFVMKKNPPRSWVRNTISPVEILAWRKESGAFEDLAAFSGSSCVVTGAGEPEEDPCEVASRNLFAVLGARPLLGRVFSTEEDAAEGPKAAILSYGFWRRHFGGDEGAIGRSMAINGVSHTIAGVMPRSFSHLYGTPYADIPEMWVSGIGLSPDHTWNDYWGVGRLKPGITTRQAEAQMDVVSARIERVHADLKGWRAQLLSFRENVSGDTKPTLIVLMAAVIFVLLIACANMANLLLARGASRAGEFATRTALGASRRRMVLQLMTESLVLSLSGGVLGILLATWGCRGMAALAPKYLLNAAPGLANGAADLRVLGFAFATAVATTLLFGLTPALQSSNPQLMDALKEAGRSGAASRSSRRFRSALVVCEVALATVLLAGAGLMVRTLALLTRADLGFNAANVLTLRVPLSGERYKQPQAQAEFWKQVVAGAKALPGVEAASVSRDLPVNGWAGQFFTTSENPDPPAGQVPDANYLVAGPDYFRALRIPLKRGRSFTERDTQTSEPVVIVNEELARKCWRGEDPLGKRLRPGSPGSDRPWLTVVGVAGNLRSQGPEERFHSEFYVPLEQYPWLLRPENLILRTAAAVKPESVAQAVVNVVHDVDRGQPVVDVKTMETVAGEPLMGERMVMALLAGFAGLALVLSTLGVYSVLSYAVARRTKEIGIRMALGAQPGSVLRLILGAGLWPVMEGIVAGVAGAMLLTRLMTDLLFGVKPGDPATFGAVTVLLLMTSMAACYLPARRMVKANPVVALRHE
ncbi:MAG TPA: ABC transporter permease [Candidatus Acidoferrum sp.]|nr:ABC transporter permease [Candidatus Acidoferrum sp.]